MNWFNPWPNMLGALVIGSCLVAHPLLVATASAQQQPKPNILFILADNVGYGDIGVYGGGELRGAPTPRIDRLASEGLRLTQFLVEPSCTPSRAALMTSRYSIRSGLSLVAVEGTAFSSKRFEGQSRIGQFGDSLMEGDAIVGKLLDALSELALERNTIVVFASDNGPDGPVVRAFGGDMPDIAFSGPFRGALGDVSEGSIRTAAIIRWPGRIAPRSSYAMFSIMDFFPTFARLAGGKVPGDRPIDGVDQTDVLLNGDDKGRREHLLTFVGPDLVAARWKQFRAYFADVAPGRSGGGGAALLGGIGTSAAPMNGYPKVFNIEADPHEEHNIGEMYEWVLGPLLKAVQEYKATVEKYPNPPAANLTRF